MNLGLVNINVILECAGRCVTVSDCALFLANETTEMLRRSIFGQKSKGKIPKEIKNWQ